MSGAPTPPSNQLGILLMLGAAVTFGLQDGLSRLLAEAYNVMSVITIRYWAFALFVLAFSASRPGGIRAVARTGRPVLQAARSVLLITQICTATYGFTVIGLVGWQVIFASYPLMIAARRCRSLANGLAGAAGWPSWPVLQVSWWLLIRAARFLARRCCCRCSGRRSSPSMEF